MACPQPASQQSQSTAAKGKAGFKRQGSSVHSSPGEQSRTGRERLSCLRMAASGLRAFRGLCMHASASPGGTDVQAAM